MSEGNERCITMPARANAAAPALPPPAISQLASQLVFPSSRHRNKAVAAVEVVPALAAAAGQHPQMFTFCLEKVEAGPLSNCWLTVGVRVGDYANV